MQNGRRRWRKWARISRKKAGKPGRNAWSRTAILKCRRRGYRLDEVFPISLRPFTAWSLVGMSEAAKKRARRFDAWNLGSYQSYHVGERLRPCPGCAKCRVLCDRPIEACTLACKHRTFEYCGESGTHCDKHCLCPCRLCRDEHGPIVECDGSGVLPARAPHRVATLPPGTEGA
jgi:hypothetical protein